MPKTVNPFARRKTSSPFSTAPRTKPGSRQNSQAEKDEADRLEDVGLVSSMVPHDSPQDVISLIRHVQENTFEVVPDRAAGMNSERISATLRYRAALPPIVSIAHLHALSASTTDTEREMARLMAMGRIRKVVIPGRGKGGSAVGEGVAVVEDWKQRIRQDESIEDSARDKYLSLMDEHPASLTTPVSSLSESEIRSLVSAGFLTNPSALSSGSSNRFTLPSKMTSGSISKAGFSNATGTFAAVGGYAAIQDSGGGGSMLATKDSRRALLKQQREMTFSLPSMGIYLKLLTEARLHLLALLKQLSPKYKEATRAFLEEKWNGNVPTDAISQQKRMRGEWTGVLPGKTKRWRDFHGLEFEWVLAECVGSGLVELFDTGSVGIGVRAI